MPMLWTLLVACTFSKRVEKFFAPENYVTPDHTTGQLLDVHYASGWKHEDSKDYEPAVVEADGRRFHETLPITSHGWLELKPLADPVELAVFVRNTGIVAKDFERVHTITGGVRRAVPSEVRFLPETLEEPLRIHMHQLHNVYNGYDFNDGDMLLIEATGEDGTVERYLFRSRQFGLRTKFGGGVLISIPLTENADAAPIFAATLAFGYRNRSRGWFGRWLGDQVALVLGLGIGSTTLDTVTGSNNTADQIDGVFNAALGGGGIEFYNFLSVQALSNLTALGRDVNEAPFTLAIGFDAVRFGVFTRDAVHRLFAHNELDQRDRKKKAR